MDKIITAKDYAMREGAKTISQRIKNISKKMEAKGVLDTPFDDSEVCGKAVDAEINWGQWIARCECGGAEAVDPDEPIFYCFSCGNYENKGKPRPVVFPDKKERAKIEKLVLERPVTVKFGTHRIERATLAEPTAFDLVDGKPLPLSRSWIPGETVRDLEKQNNAIRGKNGLHSDTNLRN